MKSELRNEKHPHSDLKSQLRAHVCVCVCVLGCFINLRCVLRLLLTWPWPVQPGVGHFKTFSCMAKTTDTHSRCKLRSVCLVCCRWLKSICQTHTIVKKSVVAIQEVVLVIFSITEGQKGLAVYQLYSSSGSASTTNINAGSNNSHSHSHSHSRSSQAV